MTSEGKKFIVVGGGIGGLAAAVALSQQGVHVTVLEQAAELGEIGAGVQLGPNAFAALDALGVGENARKRAVFTERLIMMDAVDGSEVGSFPVGQAFRDRFNNPYAVIHRADIHTSILEAAQDSHLIQVETSTKVANVAQDDAGVTAIDQNGRVFKADALIAADGVRSVIREKCSTIHLVFQATWFTALWCLSKKCPPICKSMHPWFGLALTVTWCTTRCAVVSNTTWS